MSYPCSLPLGTGCLVTGYGGRKGGREPGRSRVRITESGEKEGLTSSPLVWAVPGVGFSLALPIARAKDTYSIYRNAWQQDDKGQGRVLAPWPFTGSQGLLEVFVSPGWLVHATSLSSTPCLPSTVATGWSPWGRCPPRHSVLPSLPSFPVLLGP